MAGNYRYRNYPDQVVPGTIRTLSSFRRRDGYGTHTNRAEYPDAYSRSEEELRRIAIDIHRIAVQFSKTEGLRHMLRSSTEGGWSVKFRKISLPTHEAVMLTDGRLHIEASSKGYVGLTATTNGAAAHEAAKRLIDKVIGGIVTGETGPTIYTPQDPLVSELLQKGFALASYMLLRRSGEIQEAEELRRRTCITEKDIEDWNRAAGPLGSEFIINTD